jgi:hypothetical protein
MECELNQQRRILDFDGADFDFTFDDLIDHSSITVPGTLSDILNIETSCVMTGNWVVH